MTNFYCRAQRSRARLGNRDVVPVAGLQSRPRECQMYVTILAPGAPPQVWIDDIEVQVFCIDYLAELKAFRAELIQP